MLTLLILAAGASTRMRGSDKLLEQVAGQPLLARIARAALATGLPVRVTLPPDRPARKAALQGLDVTMIDVPDAASGMAASLRAGAKGVTGAVMILPADMPGIDAKIITQMIESHEKSPQFILRGASGDRAGHPVILPADLVPNLACLQGDEGARSLLKAHHSRVRLVPLPGTAALIDLDTPEDWAAWRASGGE
ncbi:nucleotidyltransferase family protein [Gemmobacter denitrificans]|uniref:Nucleotidyltransferase family protein n=1 Tax=Gemmobacter denitrificans TaxID=3123040 RepID=A0ABU8BQR4_9RHOB